LNQQLIPTFRNILFGSRILNQGGKLQKFRPKPPTLCNVAVDLLLPTLYVK